jgi:hypothetical protein
MTTKQQEREALAKIRKIVESLGENSYVGTALDAKQMNNLAKAFGVSASEMFRLEVEYQEERAARDTAGRAALL